MLNSQDFRKTGYYVINDDRYNIQELTCEDLLIHFGTGRSIHISGTGRDKKYIYRRLLCWWYRWLNHIICNSVIKF